MEKKVCILGAGAMGSLFGAYLTRAAAVTLVETDAEKRAAIARDGVTVLEADGTSLTARPAVCAPAEIPGPADLVIVFVKSMYERAALEQARAAIGPETWVLTLQNGAGHEAVLRDFVPAARILIGTTQDNASLARPGVVRHGGSGRTFAGCAAGGAAPDWAVELLRRAGFDAEGSADVRRLIWNKLFLNASASVLTGVLQVRLGFIARNAHARRLCAALIHEAVLAAAADGAAFDEQAVCEEIFAHLERAAEGETSIYADLRDGRRTEVDTISGAVLDAAKRHGLAAPCTEFVVGLVHALEDKAQA